MEHEIFSENKKTLTFFLEIEVEMMKKNECFWEWHGEFERELKRQNNEQLKMFEGKPKRFKNWPNLRKTRDFHDWVKSWASRQNT